MFNAGAKAWFQNSGDPIFVIKVVAPPQLTTADNVKLAIENITKCVKENHPDVKEDRFVTYLVFTVTDEIKIIAPVKIVTQIFVLFWLF